MIRTITIFGLFIASFLGAIAALLFKSAKKLSIWFSFVATIISASFGLITAIASLLEGGISIALMETNFGTLGLTIDDLSAFFILMICTLTIPVSIYSLEYVKEYIDEYNIGLLGFLYNIFFASMILVVIINNAFFFFVMWEIMSIASYLLVVYENKKTEAVFAGNLYVVMTHFGTGFIIFGFYYLGLQLNSFDFASFIEYGPALDNSTRNLVFILLLIGFGTKAGIVPVHVWLPYAHPSAPSNISSLMSGVMIKTALFMMIRSFYQFLGIKDAWCGILIVILGVISAVLGIMYATVEKDLKRMLAFSSVENIGIIFIGLGTSMIFQSYGFAEISALALIATLVHALNHSIFKGLLFMGAGSILYTTHTKNIEEMGGLIKKLPQTSIFFFIAVLSISLIPPFNGFAGEWLILQSLLLSFNIQALEIRILFTIVLGALALVGGLTLACFSRAYGIVFLALPRSEKAEHAKEAPLMMRIGMGILSVLCIVLGIGLSYLLPMIDSITSSITNVSIADRLTNGIVIFPIDLSFNNISPIIMIIVLAIVIPLVFYITKSFGGSAKTVIGDSWDCGTPLSSRNEYTGTAFSMPINRVFKGIYRPETKIETIPSASTYVFKSKAVTQVVREPTFEKYLYEPIVNAIKKISEKARRIQNGNISAYLSYIFITLMILIIILG